MVQCIISLLFSDFFFSTIMIPRKRPEQWFRRPGFLTRKVFLVKWIFVANVFSLGYRSTLLSTLVPIRYEETIDTVYDLDKSRLSLLIPKDTGRRFNRNYFGLSFSLKNGLRFHFGSVTCDPTCDMSKRSNF